MTVGRSHFKAIQSISFMRRFLSCISQSASMRFCISDCLLQHTLSRGLPFTALQPHVRVLPFRCIARLLTHPSVSTPFPYSVLLNSAQAIFSNPSSKVFPICLDLSEKLTFSNSFFNRAFDLLFGIYRILLFLLFLFVFALLSLSSPILYHTFVHLSRVF